MKSYMRIAIGLVTMVIVGILPHHTMADSVLCAAQYLKPGAKLISAGGTYTLEFSQAPNERLIFYATRNPSHPHMAK